MEQFWDAGFGSPSDFVSDGLTASTPLPAGSSRCAAAGLQLVLGDRAPEVRQRDGVRLGATSLTGVEGVDRGEFVGGEFEVEYVDVLGDPLRLG